MGSLLKCLSLLILSLRDVFGRLNTAMVSEYFQRMNVDIVIILTCTAKDEYALINYANAADVAFYTGREPTYNLCQSSADLVLDSTRKIGIYVDYDCDCSRNFLSKENSLNLIKDGKTWLFWSAELKPEDLESLPAPLHPYSDVRFALSMQSGEAVSRITLYDVYRINFERPVAVADAGSWDDLTGLTWNLNPSKYRRRVDFQNVTLQAGLTLTDHDINDPDLSKKLKDVNLNKNKDTVPRMFTSLWDLIQEIHNFNINTTLLTRYGYERRKDGSYDGLVGMLQTGQIDITVGGLGMLSYRLDLVDFTNLAIWPWRSCFFFLQPRSLNRSFLLINPFSGSVWFASFLILSVAFSCIYIIAAFDKTVKICLGSMTLYLSAILSQQGAVLSSQWLSGRFVIFISLFFGYILLNYYSGQVVSELLAHSPTTINSVEQIIESPLSLATENYSFYISRYRTVKTNHIPEVAEKINKTGGFISVEDGIQKIRGSHYAFETQDIRAYYSIDRLFSDSEICSLGLVAMPAVDAFATLKHHSPFTEIFSITISLINERGLLKRLLKRWQYPKPQCRGRMSIIPVDIENASIAFYILLSGAMAASFIFVIETVFSREKKGKKLGPINGDFKERIIQFAA